MNDQQREQDTLQPNDDSVIDATKTAESSSSEGSAKNSGPATTDNDIEDAVVIEASKSDTVSESPPSPTADQAQSSLADDTSNAAAAQNKKSRSWIGVLAFILAICALIIAGYGFQKIQQLQLETAALQSTTTQISDSVSGSLQQRISEASQSSSKAQSQISALKGDLAKQQQHVDELQDRLTRASKQISQIGSNKRKDWLLAEVEYLLRLANQRILMEKSPVGALALLQSSDQILKETDDVSIYNVRKAVAADVAALEAVPRLDVDGVFLKLAALNEQVSKLRLIPVTDKRELPGMLKQVTPDAVAESWNQGLSTSWSQTLEKLEKLVVIQHRDEPIEPLLSPEQVYFLQQNLHLMIEQAQLSLLQGQQGSFDASLSKATVWIGKYFEAKDPNTQALLRGLNELKPTQVSPALPDISSSLKALKAYLAEVHKAEGAA